MTTVEGLVVSKTITVKARPERAFAVFTERIGDWWPVESMSVHGEKVQTVVFEPRLGGRVYERTTSGEEADWATVLAFDPPSGFVLEWKVNPSRQTTELSVRFTAEGDGTRVELEHGGWDAKAYASYDAGWDFVLGKYEAAANV